MATQARVTSIDVLESFRACLITYLTRSRLAVDDIADEVRRTRVWLQTDRRMHWEHEIRRRLKLLDQAQQELMTSRLTGHQEALLVRQAAVHKAKRAVTEAEEKLRKTKQWVRDYDGAVEPVARRIETLRQYLDLDMPKAVAYLANLQKTLEGYAEDSLPPGALPAVSTSGETTPEAGSESASAPPSA